MSQMFKTIFTLFLVSILFMGCDDKKEEELKIGFVAGLSGKYSSLGTNIRDGFLLAFDEIGYKIDGKKVNIILKDDKQDEKEAKRIIDDFIKKDIKLVVGNATSSMTAITIKEVNKQKDMLLFSATASSNDFTSLDDNFLRMQVEHSKKIYSALISYLNKNNYNKIFFIYDSKNKKYAKGYKEFLESKFVHSIDLNSEYKDIVKKIKDIENNLILVVGNSVDSANIVQFIRLNGIDTKVLSSGWAKTLDFIENGGKSVEGVLFATGFDDNYQGEYFKEFAKRYYKKYNNKPSTHASQGYELAKILIQHLKNSSDISTLKNRILKEKTYVGLQGKIIFDKYGDVFREYFMAEVRNKEFTKLK